MPSDLLACKVMLIAHCLNLAKTVSCLVAGKLDKLERRTQRAIIELMNEEVRDGAFRCKRRDAQTDRESF